MKCKVCGKHISKIFRVIKDKFGFKIYFMQVKETKRKYPVCKKCFINLKKLNKLIEQYGEESIINTLKDILKTR
jgi:hypothetical protein